MADGQYAAEAPRTTRPAIVPATNGSGGPDGQANGHGDGPGERAPAAAPPHGQHAEDFALPPAPRTRPILVLLAFVAAIAVFAGLFCLGYFPRRRETKRLDAAAANAKTAAPRVRAVAVVLGKPVVRLRLPGAAEAFQQTAIHSRVDGYVKRWLVDIGSIVTKGQLLATIDTPDIDAQLRQAMANQARAVADLKLDENLLHRNQKMRSEGAASPIDVLDQQLKVNADLAAVKVAHATVRNLTIQKSYGRVTAPYAGVITSRNIDTGTLVTSGSSNSVSSMFTLAQLIPARVFVSVPQGDVAMVRAGVPARIRVASLPGRLFKGTVVRTADSLNPTTRTLRVEIDVPNKHRRIMPGMYVQVNMTLTRGRPALFVPDNALVIVSQAPAVWVVGPRDHVHLTRVSLGDDNGVTTEVLTGLAATDHVITSPGDFLRDGEKVRPLAKT